MINTALEYYNDEEALQLLIVDVMKDVVSMKEKVGAHFGAGWELIDIQRDVSGWEFILRKQEPNMFSGRYRLLPMPMVSTMSLALTHDLVSVGALIAAHDAKEASERRDRLAAGMRTPYSKSRGFRFGADYRRRPLTELVHEDIGHLAEVLSDQDVKVQALTTDYETLSVLTTDDSWIFFPFDHYSFLGEYLIRIAGAQAPEYILEPLNKIIEEVLGTL